MALYRSILVAIDDSAASRRGLAEALRLARAEHAKLWLVHVLDDSYLGASADMGADYPHIVRRMKTRGQRLLARATARSRASHVAARTRMPEILTGRAGEEIVRQARLVGADLIVLGTHGRRGLKRLVLGSDAEDVVRTAPVPVLLVRSA